MAKETELARSMRLSKNAAKIKKTRIHLKKIDPLWRKHIAGYNPWVHCKDYYFDDEVAERVCRFIEENCKLNKGSFYNKNYKLMEWQKQYYGHLFGWKHIEPDCDDGRHLRRYRNSFLYVARKNAKTSTVAPILGIGMKYDGELGSEVYCCAYTKQQSAVIYEKVDFIMNTSSWGTNVKAYKSTKIMIHHGHKGLESGRLKIVASDGPALLGLEPSMYVVDEVLAQKKFDTMENLESGVGVRKQPLGLYLSTAPESGYNPAQIKVDLARQVQLGEYIDPTYFPLVYELTPDADWHNEELWRKANPSIGVTLSMAFLRNEYKLACRNKVDEIKFKRRYLNMSVSSATSWINTEDWECCPRIDAKDLEGMDCYVGVDLSDTRDLSAVVLYFPDSNSILSYFYTCEEAMGNKLEYGTLFKDDIRVNPGISIDKEEIREHINELGKRFVIKGIGYDPYHAKEMMAGLSADGFDCVSIKQTMYFLTDPIKQIESEIREHKMGHTGSPVMKWMLGNALLKSDLNDKTCRITKQYHGSPAKIDGPSALICAKAAHIIAMTAPDTKSVYTTRGIRRI